jgi:alpha/beta hydrolase family protein
VRDPRQLPKHWLGYAAALILGLSLVSSLAEASVTRMVVTSREVVAKGMSFGDTGPYEKLRGTVFFEVDPGDPHNAVVFDLDKAPRDNRGKVEFSADFFILKPVDLERGNHRLLFEPSNRGNIFVLTRMNDAPALNNPTTAQDFGNGFLLRQGYTVAWVGWEADVLPGSNRLTVQDFPIAMQGGKPISERILVAFFDAKGAATEKVFTRPLRGSNNLNIRPYEAVSTDQTVAMAELRMRPSDSPRPSAPDIPEGELVPTSRWSFANCPNGPPGISSATDICLAGGFQNNLVYELRYKATKSPVAGLGYVASRDFVSFLRNATEDEAGNPSPVPGVTTGLCQGISQTTHYMRDFLYQGFNEDEQGQRVCDGVYIDLGGVPNFFLNYRFAQPSLDSHQHSGRYVPDTNFPRTYTPRPDPLHLENMDGILKRPATDPKVIHVDSSTDYWQSRSSLVDTDEDGTVDLVQPENVRRYLYSSTQHLVFKGDTPNFGVGNRQCQQLSNPTHPGVLARALLVALDQWVRYGIEPPESRVPRTEDGTLVPSDQDSTGFPNVPAGPAWDAVTYNGLFNSSGERDFGPRVSGNSGVIDNLIPNVLSVHSVLVPKVDEIGNDIAGIRHPFVEAPIATLTGWNLRRPEFTDGDLCDLNGMMIPLRRTREERLASGDPRPSLEELYRTHERYVKRVARAARRLARERLLLEEDVEAIIKEADESDVLR